MRVTNSARPREKSPIYTTGLVRLQPTTPRKVYPPTTIDYFTHPPISTPTHLPPCLCILKHIDARYSFFRTCCPSTPCFPFAAPA